MESRVITAVIVDDHQAVRDGVRRWCESADPKITLLDSGPSVSTAWVEPGANADVVILDLQLTQVTGNLEFAHMRRLADAGRRVVVYTGHGEQSTAVTCIDLGALSFVAKSEGGDHLVRAVHEAADGRSYTPPALSGSIVTDNNPGRPHLAPREIDALRAWFLSSSKELAAGQLNVKPRTIESYIERARIKYANAGRPAPTKIALVRRAIEDGLITLDELDDGTNDETQG